MTLQLKAVLLEQMPWGFDMHWSLAHYGQLRLMETPAINPESRERGP